MSITENLNYRLRIHALQLIEQSLQSIAVLCKEEQVRQHGILFQYWPGYTLQVRHRAGCSHLSGWCFTGLSVAIRRTSAAVEVLLNFL